MRKGRKDWEGWWFEMMAQLDFDILFPIARFLDCREANPIWNAQFEKGGKKTRSEESEGLDWAWERAEEGTEQNEVFANSSNPCLLVVACSIFEWWESSTWSYLSKEGLVGMWIDAAGWPLELGASSSAVLLLRLVLAFETWDRINCAFQEVLRWNPIMKD